MTSLDELLRRCGRRDVKALEALYRETSGRLLGVLVSMLRDRAQAEDVLQETFVRVWARAPQFDDYRGSAMAWLVSIARHRAIDVMRSRKSTTSLDDLQLAGIEPVAEPQIAPESSATAGALEHCMQQLSQSQQRCIELAYVRGLSHEEIAGSLRSPLGTVKSWVRRALLSLKLCLES
ncbi:MAG: sigma-70 family RNA polymerase sigma factor [Steroidobacteraceae bacterium]